MPARLSRLLTRLRPAVLHSQSGFIVPISTLAGLDGRRPIPLEASLFYERRKRGGMEQVIQDFVEGMRHGKTFIMVWERLGQAE